MMRRWLRDMIIDVAPILIAADDLQTRWVRILTILDHPQSATLVEFEVQWLRNIRLAEDDVDGQIHGGPYRIHSRIDG